MTSSSGIELEEPGVNGTAQCAHPGVYRGETCPKCGQVALAPGETLPEGFAPRQAPPHGLAGPAALPPAPAASPFPAPAAGASSPPPPGPALKRREVWAEVPGYEGYQIKLWLNYPRHLEEAIQGVDFRPMPPRPAEAEAPETPDEEGVARRAEALRRWTADITAWQAEREASMRAALGRVVLEHNGWRDYDPPDGTGLVLPPPQDPGFWDAIPQELMNTLLALRQQKADELPNSLRPRRRT